MDYVLMNEIYLDNTLSSCMLLNKVGDLIIGWKKHLFLIDHHTIIPYSACIHSSENSELFENETVIYEDPAVLFESNIHRNKDAPINMETYLVPYDFVLSSGNERLIFNEITATKPKEVDSVSSLDSLHAPTDVY
uniref:Uncharacterized protein n=2 Tax=Ciona intestinalis TaxID=7719 RepID=F6VT96_CIOIN